ncbi:MAG: hypothetical protein ACYTG7_03100 [Planctomycetota bacterium]|jgi:hypothetical protein
MEGKKRIKNILNGNPVDRTGFWLGNPLEETKEIFCKAAGIPYVPAVEIEPGKWEETIPDV